MRISLYAPRSWLIRLTDEGQAVITAVIDRERTVLRQVGGDLTDADMDGCVRVLSGLPRFLDNVDVD